MTLNELLAAGHQRLAALDEGPLIARRLMLALLGVPDSYLITHDNECLTPVQVDKYHSWVARAATGEPLPYIIGQAPFFDADFLVSPAVLIPRPETERLVELALGWAKKNRPGHIVDVGTGSGCIPISLARQGLTGQISAIDISHSALKIAAQNAARLTPKRPVALVQGDLLAPLSALAIARQSWLITANLPYVTDLEWTELAVGVKSYEPALALKGGKDGFVLIDRLLAQVAAIAEHANCPGALFLEIGWQQGPAGLARLKQALPGATLQLRQDFAGLDRYLSAEWK